MCKLCNEYREAPIKYILIDGSSIEICEECGKRLYGAIIEVKQAERFWHIVALINYLNP